MVLRLVAEFCRNNSKCCTSGGSAALFTSIKSAYQIVAAKLEKDEELSRYNVITYEVVLKKGIG